MFNRSSPIARREFGYETLRNYGVGKPVEPELTDKMSARNVEILNAYLLLMGVELEFSYDSLDLPQITGQEYDPEEYRYHMMDDEIYITTPDTMLKEYTHKRVRERVDSNELGYIYIGEDGILKDQYIDELANILETEILETGSRYFEDVDNVCD